MAKHLKKSKIYKRNILSFILFCIFIAICVYLFKYYTTGNDAEVLNSIEIDENEVTQDKTEKMIKLEKLQKENDEIITCAYTYTASASVVCHVGARLILIDTQKDSFEMDYDQLEAAINENTKVIIPIDLGGVPCDYEVLL